MRRPCKVRWIVSSLITDLRGDAGGQAGGDQSLLDLVGSFVEALRNAGLPVSISESLDAVETLRHVGIDDREAFRAAMGATLVKSQGHYKAFETVFEVFFALRSEDPWMEVAKKAGEQEPNAPTPGSGGGGGGDADEIFEALIRALMDSDDAQIRALAQRAVSAFAGMEPGRPVGGTYYLYRTLRNINLDAIMRRLLNEKRDSRESGAEISDLQEILIKDEFEARLSKFRDAVQAEIRRRLVEDRGSEAMARTLRKPLPEEIEFMHATTSEMVELRRAIHPLTRRLAARLARRRRSNRTDRLDIRKTVRNSLSTGGVPVEPKFRKPHPNKPEVVMLCDISGSVASFARFTLQLLYAMSNQFSRIRSFVFVDAIDEITEFFEGSVDFGEAVHRINAEADVVWVDGHSDYGHAFAQFWEEEERSVTAKSSILILGDARNNYHASEAWVLHEMSQKARHLYWLNPEPRTYWDTGDSILSDYARHCDGVFECRNLKQLEDFVSKVI